MNNTTFINDLRDGLQRLMSDDPTVLLIGEDLADPYGGAFGASRGLSTKFPSQVISTPISESGITGMGIGLALGGFRPIVEIMFGDFVTLITDQLVNVASKMNGMYDDQVNIPLVVRTPMGGGRGYGPTHSQTLDKLFFGVPGLRIVAPSIYHSPGNLLANAVNAGDSPTLFTENKLLYPMHLLSDGTPEINVRTVAGPSGFDTAIAANFTDGVPDIAIVSYGGMSRVAHSVMERLQEEEIRCLTVIPSSIQPLPIDHITQLTSEASAVVTLEEGVRDFGWGSEIISHLAESSKRRSILRRIGALNQVIPAARSLEDTVLPTVDSVTADLIEIFECI
jgi:pyruvate/2-oxoglutarate/acetoin dehydrogenase E1 component